MESQAPDQIVSLREPGFKPLKMEDLNLSESEMETLASGSRALWPEDRMDDLDQNDGD
jgi:hypothetical protein